MGRDSATAGDASMDMGSDTADGASMGMDSATAGDASMGIARCFVFASCSQQGRSPRNLASHHSCVISLAAALLLSLIHI